MPLEIVVLGADHNTKAVDVIEVTIHHLAETVCHAIESKRLRGDDLSNIADMIDLTCSDFTRVLRGYIEEYARNKNLIK